MTEARAYRLVIFDLDQTLVGGPEGRPPNSLAEQYFLLGVIEKCAELRAHGICLGIASNQGGIAFGYTTQQQAYHRLEAAALQIGAMFVYCPHHPEGTILEYAYDCECRKPRPALLWSLLFCFNVAREDALMVGDQESDRLAAEAAGIDFRWAADYFGWRDG